MRILLTGVSATGKSSVIAALAARGYRAIDLDVPPWSEWAPYTPLPDVPESDEPEREWVWNAERVATLLAGADTRPLIVSGCASNMTAFLNAFDHIVLLHAPPDVISERLASRTTNTYGKAPRDRARVLAHINTVEPLLRKRATSEIDARLPLEDVTAAMVALIEGASEKRRPPV